MEIQIKLKNSVISKSFCEKKNNYKVLYPKVVKFIHVMAVFC